MSYNEQLGKDEKDAEAMHATLLDALAAVDFDIVRLKTRMLGVDSDQLECLLGEAARLTNRRAQVLAALEPVETALIAQRLRALEAARDQWIADVAELQAKGHLPGDEDAL